MTHIYILTITDQADFNRVRHHSAWASYRGAYQKSQQVVTDLIASEAHYGLGDTFDVDINQMEVNHDTPLKKPSWRNRRP